MTDLTPQELKLARKCVKDSLVMRTRYVATFKQQMETNPSNVESKIRRSYMRFAAVEIPQLTSLLQKLGGKAK